MEKRNIHFMKVTTLYFEIKGRKMPRYSAKVSALTMVSTMPIGLVSEAPPPKPTELKTKSKTPAKLNKTPPAFLKVIGSFKTMAATIMVKMGVQVLAMLKSMEVVIVTAFKKLTCVRKSPKKEAMAICHKSFNGTFSLGMKSDNSQNKAVAPVARRQNRSMGVSTCALEMFLQQMMLNPKMQ